MPIYVRSKRNAVLAQAAVPAAGRHTGKRAELPFGLPEPPAGWQQKPPGISLCMIVKNEERFLEQALRSIHDVVDEIVIVDTGSTDRTIPIARSFGATVLEHEWRNDFAWARNRSIEPATKRWIMFIDADEELTPQSKASLIRLKNTPAYQTALWVRVFNKSDDYRGTGDMSHALIRVFPNHEDIRFRGMIHEFPTVGENPNGLQAVHSPIAIVHHGYVKEIVDSRNKGARNLAIVRAAAEAEPDEPYHWFNLGSTAFLTGDYPGARDALERMRELIGDQHRGFVPNALAVLAETYCDKLHEPIKGEEVARHALKSSPRYANAHFQLGKALVAQGRFDEARAAYQDAIDDGKYASEQFVVDDQVYIWKAHSEIGSSYVMEKNDEKAVEWFERGLKNAPKAEPLIINRAKALERLGRIAHSEEAFRAAYDAHGSEQAAAELVNHLLRQNKDREALAFIDRSYARVSAQTAVPMLLAAAVVCQRMGSPEDERYLKIAAGLRPGSAEILNPLEALLHARGKSSEVGALIAAEDATPPQASEDWARRSRRAALQGDYEKGIALANAGLQTDPANAALNYAAGAAALQLGKHELVLEYIGRIKESPAALAIAAEQTRAAAQRALGRNEAALSTLQRAIDVESHNVDALLAHAEVAGVLGRIDVQEASLKRAFAVDATRASLPLAALYLRTGRIAEAGAIAESTLAG
jgi:glycosyltransferase involved in cell wall biosynthesis